MFKNIVQNIIEKRVLHLLQIIEDISKRVADDEIESFQSSSVVALGNKGLKHDDILTIKAISNEIALIKVVFTAFDKKD